LLVIECQTSLLHRQGLAIGTPLHKRLSAKHPTKTITLAATNTRQELVQRLGEIQTIHERYRAVLIVAHSNSHGLRLTDEDGDELCDWKTFATWLERLEPEQLFLIACDAGRFTGVCTLFRALPSLRKVYASPVPINPHQAGHLTLLVQQVITERHVDKTLLRITQGIALLASKGVLFEWTRADCQDHNAVKGHAQTIVAQFLK
jgi:hypothetical protein